MIKIEANNYDLKIFENQTVPEHIAVVDHLGGFDENLDNSILYKMNKIANPGTCVATSYFLDHDITKKYPNLKFSVDTGGKLEEFRAYHIHPEVQIKNLVCSFNGSPHVSRKLLTAALHRFGFSNNNYVSKNFTYASTELDGHIRDYPHKHTELYRQLLVGNENEDYFQSINSFGHVRFNHNQNIYNLEHKLTESFVHIVSETMATSYYPFLTEKFLYSVVTRGLFLAYAQPRWHAFLSKYFGFKLYDKIFDYGFDQIYNPIERLIKIMEQIQKFSQLSWDELKFLYNLETEAIQFNYDHYMSGNYRRVFELN
jgi:hypothetical protein